MIDGHGFISLPDRLGAPVKRKIAVGARVRITAGPFEGMCGLYAGMSAKDRELWRRVLVEEPGERNYRRLTSIANSRRTCSAGLSSAAEHAGVDESGCRTRTAVGGVPEEEGVPVRGIEETARPGGGDCTTPAFTFSSTLTR
jgi:hypothetical protein